MSIQSTQPIPRKHAIERILKIQGYREDFNFIKLEENSFEEDEDIKEFVSKDIPELEHLEHVEKWTNSMLEDVMDLPYFRHSMFNNYDVQ